MATRFYLPSSGAAEVTPNSWLAWERTDNAVGPLAAVTTKIGSAVTTAGSPQAAGNYVALGRWVSDELAAQTISGTVKGVVNCFEEHTGLNARLAFGLKVIQPDGSDRATLLGLTSSQTGGTPPEFFALAFRSRRCLNLSDEDTISLTSQAVQDQDRLVIEVGYHEAAGSVGSSQGQIRYGDTGSDLPHADDDESGGVPWLEFSADLSFYSPAGMPVPQVIFF